MAYATGARRGDLLLAVTNAPRASQGASGIIRDDPEQGEKYEKKGRY